MPGLNPPPGSAGECTAFAALQARLPALFRNVFSDPAAPRTVVVVPGLSMDGEVLSKVVGGRHYEERQLAMLMLLRLPNTRLVFVSSTRIEPSIIDYHLGLLQDVPVEDARRRLVLLSAADASPQTLTQKILDRPRLLERIRAGVGDPALAHLTCFNVTPLRAHARGAARHPAVRLRPRADGTRRQERQPPGVPRRGHRAAGRQRGPARRAAISLRRSRP